jgi:predicted RNase H-like HicB family nuclease
MRYRVVLHRSHEGFDVSVPGLPGCVSQGATEAEALESIKCAIKEYLDVVRQQVVGQIVRDVDVPE